MQFMLFLVKNVSKFIPCVTQLRTKRNVKHKKNLFRNCFYRSFYMLKLVNGITG